MDNMIKNLSREEFRELCDFLGVECNFLDKNCLKDAIIIKRRQKLDEDIERRIKLLKLDEEIRKKILEVMTSNLQSTIPTVEIKVEETVEREIVDPFNFR